MSPEEHAELMLRQTLSPRFDAGTTIRDVMLRPHAYRTSFALDEIDLILGDGSLVRMLRKDLSYAALRPNAASAKPRFLYDPLREIETYRTILAPLVPDTATYYGSHVDRERDLYWLFLERLSGSVLWQVGEFETWREVARWLARFHLQVTPRIDLETAEHGAHLLRYDAAWYARWRERALAHGSRWGGREQEHALKRIVEAHARASDYLIARPSSFIHGEFFASNVLIAETEGRVRICPIDWEVAAIGPALVDLAALTSGGWSEAERDALALSYLQMQRDLGAVPQDAGAFRVALDCCRFHVAVQWLGWASDWTPPPEHAHDWFREAAALADKLEL